MNATKFAQACLRSTLVALLLLSSAAAANKTTIGTFTGAAAGKGLDLQGNFTYAVNVGPDGPAGKAGDAQFTADNVTGVTVQAGNQIAKGGWLAADYGAGADNAALAFALSSIRWAAAPNVVTVTLGVEPKVDYKLQLLFGEQCCPGRGFNILVDGATIAQNFLPGAIQAGLDDFQTVKANVGAVVTYEFTSVTNTVTIVLSGPAADDPTITDHNAILNAFTLERISAVNDSDKDGLPDDWELKYFGDLSKSGTDDVDNDGLTNLEEFAKGTDPKKADSDGDGLSDGDEVKKYGSDPLKKDTDGDRLSDGLEVNVLKSNPTKVDSDGDGLSDYYEYHLLSDPASSTNKPKNVSVNLFYGVEANQGLDLNGTFVYAVDFASGEEPGQIKDAYFTTDDVEGVTVVASHVANNWNQNVYFGDTPEQQALALLLSSIRWSDSPNPTAPDVNVTFGNLQVGASYKLQLIFGEYLWGRGFNVSINGRLVAKEFAPFQWQGGFTEPNGATPRTNGVVLTYTFIANSTNLVFNMDGRPVTDPAMADHNATINGATLELLSKAVDSDGDGLWDAWEMANFGNLAQKASDDPDKDGLTNLQEQALGTDPNVADTDGDGLNDGAEVAASTNPLNADTDGDGLSDSMEVNTTKTDPNKADTDGDGLSDGAEVNIYKTNPLKSDTDGDGVSDGKEIAIGTDPLKAGKPTTVSNIVIQQVTGGDPGEGLDLQGRFIYAVNVSSAGAAGKAYDADFTADNVPGVTVTAQNDIPAWDLPEFGDTAADDVIEKVMQSIRWSAGPNVWKVELANLIPGSTYKLQLLFYEQCCGTRGFNVTLDGNLIAEAFMPAEIQQGVNNTAAGAVISAEFTTYNDKAVIIGDGAPAKLVRPEIGDINATLDGFTLEVLKEAPKPTVITNVAAHAFTGGDPGEGLDLQGKFKYAFNVSSAGAAGKAYDADFTADNVAGVTVTAPNNIAAWDNPTYGTNTADLVVAKVASSIRYGTNWTVQMTGLTPGKMYKLQLLFYEQCCAGRGFDVSVDGQLIVPGFMPAAVQGGANKTTSGAVISAEFLTYSDKVTILGDGPAGKAGNPAINDTNATLDGVTLEEIDAFTPPPPLLRAATSAGKVVITFDGTLQSADKVSGPWTPVVGTSPLTVTPNGNKFYRSSR